MLQLKFSVMPVQSETKSCYQNKPPIDVTTMAAGQSKNKHRKKIKKGKKLKLRRQFMSLTSIVDIQDLENSNIDYKNIEVHAVNKSESNSTIHDIYKPIRQSKSEKLYASQTRLPSLPKSLTPTSQFSYQSYQSNISRSSISCRLPVTLPANLQPGAHERRKKLPLLAAIKPDNERSERDRFMRANYNYNPLFIYKFPAESDILNKMGTPSDRYLSQAILIMENALERFGSYENYEEQAGGRIMQRSSIMALVQRYLKREELEREILVNLSEDLLSRGSMTSTKGKPTLNVNIVNLREYWVEGLLRHEIGTHYLRSYNNKFQDWFNWKVRKDLGLKPFNPTEEGLASLHSVLFRKDPCLWRIALLYYTAYRAAFLSLKELFHDLGQFVNDSYTRWDYCIRAKRGQVDTSMPGGFCKDQVYLEGALQLLKNRKQINFHLLMQMGKIAWEDIDKLNLLVNTDETKIPFFMQDLESYRKHLDRICEANGLTDDILNNV